MGSFPVNKKLIDSKIEVLPDPLSPVIIFNCGDRNIENGLIISILSLLKNVEESLNIYVVTINSNKWNIEGVVSLQEFQLVRTQ